MEAGMAQWRKTNPTGREFKAPLNIWSLAFSALVGMRLLLSLHRHV
jgi:hypothetical protein